MMDVVVDTELEEDEHGKRPDVKQVLARQIVATIRYGSARMLPSRGRVMNAGDILILLRDRQKGGLYHVSVVNCVLPACRWQGRTDPP